jgi:hypothetical protein
MLKLPLSDSAVYYEGSNSFKLSYITNDPMYDEIISDIGIDLKIRKNVTSHFVRHTLATQFL